MTQANLHLLPLPYPLDAHRVFECLRPLGDAVLLDSAQPATDPRFGRYDIIAAAPDAVLRLAQGTLSLRRAGLWQRQAGDPFAVLQRLLAPLRLPADSCELPFCGGLIGHFAYDLGRYLERLPAQAQADIAFPELRVGLYLWAVVIDHQTATSTLVAHPLANAGLLTHVQELLLSATEASVDNGTLEAGSEAKNEVDRFHLTGPIQANLSREQYHAALARVDDYIHAGDCYQINFTQRFSAPCSGDPWRGYRAMRQTATTPFSAYLESEDGAILSLSPERFLQVAADGAVETRPIKGTRPRGASPEQDLALAEALRQSTKDRAENVMIVDLLRNDLGKVCTPGSVHVPELFAIESYPNVHHLVSSVRGQLAAGCDSLDLLRQCFPGGSITGAPKIRAMEIIDELEPQRRSIYCGSIGYISATGAMDTSITIRTLLVNEGRIHCWAGGGIVADSDPAEEYQESFDKVNNLLQVLRSL